MKMDIGPPYSDLEDEVEISDRAVATDQQTAPDHWADAQQHHFQLIDDGVRSIMHGVILT